ncbi:MAG: type II toxin-antitoxin system VapC family toxin, partial [Verrucomicrobiae bacterium]|nr:type II toxin-antitoxin system VapC family toxin [Verrucomicrobiae bacterium]
MKCLLDTHLLLWAASEPSRLSDKAKAIMGDRQNDLYFSPASLWEITIKLGLGRPDFSVNPRLLKRGLLENDYRELPIISEHCLAVGYLAPLHKDPFDRLLIAQASHEGIHFLTADHELAAYQ